MKKTISLLLALLMMVSLLTACGGNSSGSNSSGNSSSTGDTAPSGAPEGGFTDYSGGFPNGVTIQIPVYDRGFEGWNVTNNYYTRWVQEEFGDPLNITVEYVAIPRSDEVNTYMQLIAAHTSPDIIFHYDMPMAVSYWNEGAMQAINYDEVEYYAPTYWANMGETIQTYGKIGDDQAFILAGRNSLGTYYQWIPLIRKDWLDQVGMDVPTNREEELEVARAWKEAGLGVWGYDLLTSGFNFYYGYIGSDVTDEEKALYLDLNVAPLTWRPVEEYLRSYNTAYNEGIIDTEFYLNLTDADMKANFVSGKSGTYGFYIANNTDVFSSLKANFPDAEVAVRGAAPVKGNPPYYYEYANYGMIMGISTDTTDEERAAVYMYLEWLSQSENLFKMEHGVEGETFNYDENGLPVHFDNTAESRLSNNNNKDYWCLVEEAVTYGSDEQNFQANKSNWAPEGYEYLIDDSYNNVMETLEYGLITPIFTKAVETTGEYSSDLNDLWREACTALVRCNPNEFDSLYEKYCKEYLNAGYQEILDEKQALFDEGSYMIFD